MKETASWPMNFGELDMQFSLRHLSFSLHDVVRPSGLASRAFYWDELKMLLMAGSLVVRRVQVLNAFPLHPGILVYPGCAGCCFFALLRKARPSRWCRGVQTLC